VGPSLEFRTAGTWEVNNVCGVLLPDTAAWTEPQKEDATTTINNAKHTNPALLILFIASSELETAPDRDGKRNQASGVR